MCVHHSMCNGARPSHFNLKSQFIPELQICPGLNANEIQIPYDSHHKVSSLVKRQQNTYNYVKYEVI